MKRYILFLFVLVLLLLPTVFAQFDDAETSTLILTVGSEACALVIKDSFEAEATAESSEEPELPEATEVAAELTPEATEAASGETIVLTVSDDCDPNAFRLASNGTLWVAISLEGEEDWQLFETIEGDTSAPNFDRRGRFIGCRNSSEGEQVCRVQWEYEGTSYLIEIPIFVGDAFTAGVPVSTSEPDSSTTGSGTGQWGTCGSCSTCNGPANICVTSPEGLCVADPAGCGPQSTEEP